MYLEVEVKHMMGRLEFEILEMIFMAPPYKGCGS